jgi:hypothetical protein
MKDSLWKQWFAPLDLATSIDVWYGKQRTDNIRRRTHNELSQWWGNQFDKKLMKELIGITEDKYGGN